MSTAVPAKPGRLPARTANFAQEFLSALFMTLRTAQIHDPTNQAYQSALTRLHHAAEALYAATSGFEFRIVEDSFFINGSRLPFDHGSAAAMRTLRNLLEAQSLGGFTIESAPTAQGLIELVALIVDRGTKESEGYEDELRKLNIGLLGPQQFVDETSVKVDRSTYCVHTYAKLLLAVRERVRQLTPKDAPELDAAAVDELRAIRVVQDLVELVSERIDLLLRLATNTQGSAAEELHGVNTCVLSVAMGYSLGFHRRDLGDIGLCALFHHLGPQIVATEARHDTFISAALSRMLAESGAGRSLFTRAMILSEQMTSSGSMPRKAHPFSRVLRVASAYSRLVLGYAVSGGASTSPLDALATMRRDSTGWLDPAFVDLLINLLRAYPPGTQVVLQTGQYAIVSTPLNPRWDRPIVRVASRPPTSVDLLTQVEGRFINQIVATQKFLGAAPAQGQATTAPPPQTHNPPPTARAKGPLTAIPTVTNKPPDAPALPTTAVSTPTLPPTPLPPISDLELTPLPRIESVPPPRLPPRAPSSIANATTRPAPITASSLTPLPGSMPPPPAPGAPSTVGPLDEPAPIVPAGRNAGPQSRLGQPRPDRLLGSFLAGKYRILEKIGEGGMGTVFSATQEPIDRQVAVKVLHHSLTNDDVAVHRFKREARVISRMRHPNTVTVYDFGQTQAGELYLVMEFLEGQTVAQLVRTDGPLPGLRGARIIRQACGSLSEAHELGIIHRDLKPDNIFLTRYGDQHDFVKVLDFGLVKLADNDSLHRLTQQGKVYGTPRYMAPEQAEGKPIDHRSDIYTLGVVLYELLMGRPLFVAETMVALLVKHIQSPPPPMAAVRPDLDVDPRLESIVMWALAKRPEDRPQSVKELARELERWEQEAQHTSIGGASFAAGLAPPAPPPPPPPPQTWTKSGPNDDFGTSLNTLLDGFLKELSPLDESASPPPGPPKPKGDD